MAEVFAGVGSPEEFWEWGAWASDRMLAALHERRKAEVTLRVTLAKIAGGLKG